MMTNKKNDQKRIVVTGLGAVTPLGIGIPTFWKAIQSEKCGVRSISLFDTTLLACKVAAEVPNFNPDEFMTHKQAQRTARFTQFALIAAREALSQAGLIVFPFEPETPDSKSSASQYSETLFFGTTEESRKILENAAIFLGNGIGGLDVCSETHHKMYTKGPSRVSAMTIPKMIANEAAGNVSIEFGTHGVAHTIVTACASGTDAIGHALDHLRLGKADIAIAGGTEAAITEFGIASFCAIKALSTSFNDTPEKASRPFDQDRDGFVMGEGAGILILETLEHAQKRGAKIFAEVAGYGANSDAYHLTAPDSEANGPAQAIQLALKDAGLSPDQIDYVNAHGTSTPTNDPVETLALKKAFGEHAYRMKVSSTKGMIGHCLGAAGAIEAVVCVLALQDQFFPATINLEHPDSRCDLDYVPNKGVSGPMNAALSTSLGFGGHNSVLVLKKWEN